MVNIKTIKTASCLTTVVPEIKNGVPGIFCIPGTPFFYVFF